MHLKRGVIFRWVLFVANCGGLASTVRAQEAGWNGGWAKMEDPVERAFTLDVPQGWSRGGGSYRLGYGDVRVMVDLWSSDSKINIRLGDVWFLQPMTRCIPRCRRVPTKANGIAAEE